MEPSTKLEELYSYHQKGMEEILSRQQLEELFRHPEQKTGEFEHWLNTQCQTGQLKKLVPLEEPTKFGRLIAERRKEIGMSVEQLSRLCLISPEQLKWIEAGVFNPDQNTLQWLANAIGVHRSNLLNGQIKLKPDYQECLKAIEGMQDELLLAKEHLNRLNQFVADHGVTEYQVQKHEDQYRVKRTVSKEVQLNGVIREWKDEKSARQFADQLNQRKAIMEDKTDSARYVVRSEEGFLKAEKEEENQPEEIYLIVDTKTGEAVLDQRDVILEFRNKETAQSYADRLNQKEIALESSTEKTVSLQKIQNLPQLQPGK